MKAALDRAGGHVHRQGDLLIGETVHIAQEQNRPLVLRQTANGGENTIPALPAKKLVRTNASPLNRRR